MVENYDHFIEEYRAVYQEFDQAILDVRRREMKFQGMQLKVESINNHSRRISLDLYEEWKGLIIEGPSITLNEGPAFYYVFAAIVADYIEQNYISLISTASVRSMTLSFDQRVISYPLQVSADLTGINYDDEACLLYEQLITNHNLQIDNTFLVESLRNQIPGAKTLKKELNRETA